MNDQESRPNEGQAVSTQARVSSCENLTFTGTLATCSANSVRKRHGGRQGLRQPEGTCPASLALPRLPLTPLSAPPPGRGEDGHLHGALEPSV